MLLIGWLSFFFFFFIPSVFSFPALGSGNCKKRITLESIILLLTLGLFMTKFCRQGFSALQSPGYLVNGAMWFDLCSTDP